MKQITGSWVATVLALFLVAGCGDDIKGEQGEQGIPGSVEAAASAVKRPPFRNLISEPTIVSAVVVGNQPIRVTIEDTLYSNTAETDCDLSVSGAGGLETGSTLAAGKIYYLYAIPSETEGEFSLVASERSPEIGPANFQNWTYLGAFRTKSGSDEIQPFLSEHGRYLATSEPLETFNETSSTLTALPQLIIPPFASHGVGELIAEIAGFTILSLDGATDWISNAEAPDAIFLDIPIVISRSLWIRAVSGAQAQFRLYGWVENPAAFP